MLNISAPKQFLIWGTVILGLLFAMPNAFYPRVETHNDAQTVIDSGLSNDELETAAAQWPGFLPSGLVNLGLDLRGGAHLLVEVDVESVQASYLDGLWPNVRDALADESETVGFVTGEDGPTTELRVRISESAGAARALEIVRGIGRPVTSLTGAAGSSIEVTANGTLLTITLSEAEKVAMNTRTMSQTLEIIRRRIDEAGTREPTIQRQGTDRVLVQVPGVGSAQEVIDLIGTTAQLTFNPVLGTTSDPDQSPGTGNILAPDAENEGVYYILERSAVVTGEDLENAQLDFDQNGAPAVAFRFNTSAARKFGDYTQDNIGSLFAIVLDGKVISAPRIQSHIPGGSGIISGTFTVDGATNLAILLRAGALPAKLTVLEERTVGPELGQDSIDAGKIACIVAGIGILVFMVLSYGLFGVFANIALIINVGLIFGLLSIIGATLTLPGIAGIVLTIGMAVDANVIIFERIREELKTAKGAARAIELGYEKALSSIIDANITTFITAVILFVFGSGPVSGFAVTLGFGIITSVFTAIFVTRSLIVIWFERRRPKTIEV